MKLLFLTAMTAGTLFTLQNGNLLDKIARAAQPAAEQIVAKLIVVKKIVAPATPSDFDRELAMSSGELMKRWDPFIAEASRRFGVPEAWIGAVIRMESGGRTMLAENRPMMSSTGAMGIMQVMPGTYEEMREQYGLGTNPYDPHDNVLAGTAYLRWLKMKYGYPAMFAAYNDGPGHLESHLHLGRPLPGETKSYVKGIAKILDSNPHIRTRPSPNLAQLTRPDGTPIWIDGAAVLSVRAADPGEFGPGVQSVIGVRKSSQAVLENISTATAILREHGGKV
jgi:soluble lytic murein transglycosylase-like protein